MRLASVTLKLLHGINEKSVSSSFTVILDIDALGAMVATEAVDNASVGAKEAVDAVAVGGANAVDAAAVGAAEAVDTAAIGAAEAVDTVSVGAAEAVNIAEASTDKLVAPVVRAVLVISGR